MARLKEMYQSEIVDAMIKKFGYKNIMEVPKLDKIVINMGVGEAKENAKVLDSAVRDMEIITGQKAVLTKAKKSVANFKLSIFVTSVVSNSPSSSSSSFSVGKASRNAFDISLHSNVPIHNAVPAEVLLPVPFCKFLHV